MNALPLAEFLSIPPAPVVPTEEELANTVLLQVALFDEHRNPNQIPILEQSPDLQRSLILLFYYFPLNILNLKVIRMEHSLELNK